MPKPFLLFSAVVLFVCAAAPSMGRIPQEPSGKGAAKSAVDTQARAKKLYAQDCSMCHGDNGNGQTDLAKDMQLTLTDWTDAKSLSGKSDQDLFSLIRNGKDKMPPEDAGRAKDDEVKGLILYIRGFSKGSPAAAAAAPPQ
jgi:mono/diheme cytochrome c family protein